jgi:hypothetical protein
MTKLTQQQIQEVADFESLINASSGGYEVLNTTRKLREVFRFLFNETLMLKEELRQLKEGVPKDE